VSAVVHLHAPHAVAVSCLADLAEPTPLPALTPYFIMRIAPLGVVGYFRPGSEELAAAVGEKAVSVDCMLLRNHGLICTGSTFAEAADRALELEETCRLYLTLGSRNARTLTSAEVRELEEAFPKTRR
jgi:ribulose-5-phosphate 4-epimerase/fuculose-1-phosphate aldolase